MEWKKGTLSSILKINKEKLIFLFCSGLLLFVLALPGDSDSVVTGAQVVESDAVTTAAKSTATSQNSYEAELESRIRDILAGVEGVGEVDVMVVLKSSEEKVIHVDKNTMSSTTEEKTDGGTSRTTKQQELSESTVMDGQTSSPVIEKEIRPELSGIIISADGGGSAVVKAEISEAMEALFGLPSHKIKVLKRVKKGV